MTFFGTPEAAQQFIEERKKRREVEMRSASDPNAFQNPSSPATEAVANRRPTPAPTSQVTPETSQRDLNRQSRREVNDLINKRDQLTKEGFTGVSGNGGLAELAQMQIDRKTGVPVGTHTATSQGATPIASDSTRLDREARRLADRGDLSGATALRRGAAQERLADQKEKQVRSNTRVDASMRDIERRRDKALQDTTKELTREAKASKMKDRKSSKRSRTDRVASRRDGGGGGRRKNRKSKK